MSPKKFTFIEGVMEKNLMTERGGGGHTTF